MEEVSKFYEWMLMIKSIHLAVNQQVSKAFEKIIKNKVGS